MAINNGAAPRITLDQWRALAAVVEAGGYAQAAEKLHRSQSTVTYAVQQIEAQLGVKAFRIEGRRARLTPTGDLLYRRAQYLLEEAGALEQAAQRYSAGWEPQIRLAVEVIFPTWLLLRCLDRFSNESPDTQIELSETVLGHRTDALVRGDVDLAIFSSVPAGFIGETLVRMPFILTAHPDHPLHKLGRTLTERDFRPYRHVVLRETSPERSSEVSMRTAQRWTVGSFATLIEAVRDGLGFAWLPEEKIRPELAAGTLKPLPLHEGAQRFAELYLVFANREHAGPGTNRLAQILREGVATACAAMTDAPNGEPPAPGAKAVAPAAKARAKKRKR